MTIDKLILFPNFKDYTDYFTPGSWEKKHLHSIAEQNLRIILKEIYPESHPVNEINVDGGRGDLIYYFDSEGHSIHFEIFASYGTVIKDLRLLEQSEFNIQVAILIDEEIDPSVSKKYFREKPINPFPCFNLSQIFIESKIDDFKREIGNIIKTFQLKPQSIDLKTAQLFFNKLCALILKIYKKEISYSETSKILKDLQQSREKKVFDITIIRNQENNSIKLEILEKIYSLELISNDSKIKKILKKNKKVLYFNNFSNISQMFLELKDYALIHYGLDVKISNDIPIVIIKSSLWDNFIGDMKITATKSLKIEIYNKSKFPIEIVSSGILANNHFFKDNKHQILRLGQNSSNYISVYLFWIKIALEKEYKEPYVFQRFIKLQSGEYFFTKKIKMPKKI